VSTLALSCLYAIRNRADLFARTLDTYVLQALCGGYEILVLDDRSTDHLKEVCAYYHDRWGLPLRYLGLDVTRCGLPVGRCADGSNSPVVAWNVGIQQARGTRVAISSPEVCHRGWDNLLHLADATHPAEGIVANVYDHTWAGTEFGGWIGGGPKQRPLPFLASYDRDMLLAIGGFEEAFMAGRAFDDNEFAERFELNGGVYRYVAPPELCAEHLPHARAPIGDADHVNAAIRERLRGQRIANVGHQWGNPACIVEVSV
jgi:glycosyltransferase involved in cell wall biosynthesis